ncbi:MAG: hypothetical protein P9E24_14605 [Candidatus Competibacter sp.]|nr:hypothetical protein [Candidatus Competibacter sp.]MDG4582855.1 hypothetical protein [Candidatus Competibacter sp.]
MRALSCFCFLLGALPWLLPASAARLAPEEFIVPLQAMPTPARVKSHGSERVRTIKDDMTEKPALQARTAQGAITAAIEQNSVGCRMIRFKTGFGWVATGMARYPATENPVATRRVRQEARFKAFLDARTRLAGCWRDLTPEARQRVAEQLETDDGIRLALINLATNEQERRQQALKILARGFVAYSSENDAANRTIYVNLVTTPKTAVRLTRPDAVAIETVALKEGVQQLLAEIEGRLIPPTGNRLIVVNATGELALVGYAVNLIGAHPEPAAQEKLRADAAKIAMAHATEALVGLAAGDDTAWIGGLDEISQAEIRAAASGYDDSEPSVRRFSQIRELAMSGIKDTAGLQALREGRLPPEAAVKQFDGEDSVAVAVIYTPNVKKPESAPVTQPPVPAPTSGEPASADNR